MEYYKLCKGCKKRLHHEEFGVNQERCEKCIQGKKGPRPGRYKSEEARQVELANAREFYRSKKKPQRIKNKLEAIRMFGSACSRCCYNKNLAGLDFDHLDESEKIERLSTFFVSKVDYVDELNKCQLLCSNCHRLKHHEDWTLSVEENTQGGGI